MSAEMQSLTVLNLSRCDKISSFPKFTGIMKSLSELDLRYTAIKKVETSSIEFLTALTSLDLSGCEDLECLPSNMNNLSLTLFSRPKSLPRLPSGVRCINLSNEYLKWSAARVKLSIWSQPLSQWCPNDNRSSRLKFRILFHYLLGAGLLCRKTVYGISFEEEEEETLQNSITIKLPSNWYNSKWIGIALWASLSLSDREPKDGIRARVIALGDMPQNHCASELFTTLIQLFTILKRFGDEYKSEIKDRICLLYLSRDDWFAKVGNDECSQIKIIFEEVGYSYDTKIVGEYGVSLVYEQDVDEFNQTNAQCLIGSFREEVSIFKLTDDDDDDADTVGDDADDDDVNTVGGDDDDDDDDTVGGGDDDDDDEDNYYDAYTVSDDNA